MCGIIGYAGEKPALAIILDGLKRLEYRGYDSSGAAIMEPDGSMYIRREAGKLTDLTSAFDVASEGTVGIGHTRWATHGKPTTWNAHPHTDSTGDVAVVHNGIVENHAALREELKAAGHEFRSQTDTEVIPHLIERYLKDGASFEEAVRLAASRLAGAQAVVAISRREPDKIVGLRIGHAGGMAVGYGDGEMLLASDLPAIGAHATAASYLSDREIAVVTREGVRFMTLEGEPIEKERQPVPRDPAMAAKGPYRHFMLKEIMEQPETLMRALRDRLDFSVGKVMLPDFPFSKERVRGFTRVVLVGMGTSYNAAVVGRHMLETLARLPCHTENASEFRYLDPVVDSDTLVVSVSQSGETVDTLAAMEEARGKGAAQITICNVAGAEATRMADYTLLINAGPEIGVASTKTMTGSMLCLYLLAIYLGQLRGTLDDAYQQELLDEVVRLPELVGSVVGRSDDYEEVARDYFNVPNFLLLGRGINHPMAMEGALKLKEISYIHAEGYPSGEMKHGPIALIDEHMPVLAIAIKDKMYDKMLGNIEEVKARDGRIIALITAGDEEAADKADDVISVPAVSYLVSPIITVAPLQLLAYHIAVRRGADVDQPRNLAKTVTVE